MEDFGGFEGNAQTLRLLTETLFGDGREGMNPTRALLDAVLKYKTLHRDAGGAENHYLYDEQERFISFVLGGAEFPADLQPGKDRNGLRSIECQIMDWADDTAYSINDLSDGIRAGFITEIKLAAWAEQQSLTGEEAGHVEFLIDAIESGRFEGRLGRSIGEHIRGCSLAPRDNFLAHATRRYAFDLAIDEEVRRKAELNKRIALELVFRAPKLQQLDFKAELMLERLFEALREQYIEREKPRLHLLPDAAEKPIIVAPDKRARARLVCDWLANLTDRAAFQAHQRMFDTSGGPSPDFV
jgi:dGTPase